MVLLAYMTIQEITQNIEKYTEDPLSLLKTVGGYYECPKDTTGKRLGPLVGYAGKYTDATGVKKQYIGDVYANFSKAEEYPVVLSHFAQLLKNKFELLQKEKGLPSFDVVCGPQMGGVAAAILLALTSGTRYVCAEKEVLALKTETMREQSRLIFGRHALKEGENVVIMEDVLNNFSTTKETIELIEKNGGRVIAILGLLNRSPHTEDSYEYTGEHTRQIPVISLVRKHILEYTQEDPTVLEDMQKGNVVLKPKNAWSTLMQASEQK